MLTGTSRNGSAPAAERVANIPPARSVSAFFIAALMAIIAAGAWAWMNQPVELPDVPERISGFAYSGFQRNQDPTEQLYPSVEELNSDLALLGRQAEAIRTYSSIDNANVPRLASDHGLLVTAGAWLDRRSAHNE